MPRIQRHAELVLCEKPSYDPRICKTCQKRGVSSPRVARVVYGDCEEHFQRRVRQLAVTGVTIIQGGKRI